MALSEFYWGQQLSGVAEQQQATAGRTYYEGFTLNGVDYAVGDCVLLYPESDGEHYIGRINSTFCLAEPSAVGASDPHCIEVNWFERRTNLEPDFRGCPEKEREVVELEETDINPIGCISGKCVLLRALKYEDAAKQAKGLKSCWFFCRGVFKQHLNCFVVYRELAALEEQAESKKPGKRAQQQTAPEHVADSEEVLAAAKRPRPSDPTATQKDGEQWEHPAQQAHHSHGQHAEHDSSEEATTAIGRHHSATTAARPLKVVATGRVCVECGATQTPQWREGPQGPKTLCNACGVRYVRAQQRANKRAVGTVSTTRPAPTGQAARKPVPVSSNAAGIKPKAKLETAASTATGAVAASARARITSLPEEPASRPMRQAALLAANKTAQFARTGVFPVSEDELKQHTTSQPAPVQQQQQQQVQQVAGPSAQLQHMLPAKPALPPTSTPESNDDSNNSSAEDYMFDTADKLLMQQAWPEERGLGCDDGSGDDLLGLSGADSAMPIAFVATDDEDAMRSVASMDDAVQSALGPSAASKMIMQQGHLGHDSLFESFEALSSHDHLLVPLDGGADTKARGASSSAAAGTVSKAFPSCMNEFASHFSSSPMHMDCDASLIHMSGSHHHALMDVSNAGGLLAADGSELVTVHT